MRIRGFRFGLLTEEGSVVEGKIYNSDSHSPLFVGSELESYQHTETAESIREKTDSALIGARLLRERDCGTLLFEGRKKIVLLRVSEILYARPEVSL